MACWSKTSVFSLLIMSPHCSHDVASLLVRFYLLSIVWRQKPLSSAHRSSLTDVVEAALAFKRLELNRLPSIQCLMLIPSFWGRSLET